MFIWVMYDIGDTHVRTKISEDCRDFGLERFQKSVFFGEATDGLMQRLAETLKSRMKERDEERKSDSILVFTMCKSCLEKKIVIGKRFNEDDYRKKNCLIIG
ncbi:CRISPR-associated protein Cas2 [Methanomicrobium sp. W14]|uniref:CRISPR-associated endonuclease Cas2 n=1 Tax=Methanomicrobium sp. W14 TaxID=2817839 RepID=UPI001AE0EA65|nr:CRISPR-associated endonuclease Cas2 [Methanomicrobium sp. W14]MBP2132411.1 CRISPR-associated protein Cas2 [Methanomicrobium sp. W14]